MLVRMPLSMPGKRLVDKAAAFLQTAFGLTSSQPIEITRKTKDTLARLIDDTNRNNLLAGGSVVKSTNAISIQDLVRRLNNGAGMKIV